MDTLDRSERIRRLAYDLWVRRGRPMGSPTEDWYAAEQEVEGGERLLLDDEGGDITFEPQGS